MLGFELGHLADDALLQNLATLVSRDRAVTAALLAYIAEADARRLYAPAGYSSMHEYCVTELHLSDEAAGARIRASPDGRECRGTHRDGDSSKEVGNRGGSVASLRIALYANDPFASTYRGPI